MSKKSYLKDVCAAHRAGDDKHANDLLNEGINYYSQRILSAYNGQLKTDLPLIVLALKFHYETNLNLCGDFGREIVKILADQVSVTCIHN